MNGKTHLAIGASIGGVYSLVHAPAGELDTMLFFIAVGGFSALAADLDGQSVLTRKITKLSSVMRTLLLVVGTSLLIILGWWALTNDDFRPDWLLQAFGGAIICILLGLLVSRGFWRNALVSVVGILCILYGFNEQWYWLIGLGVFITIAPWLNHRGLTHTIWAIPCWAWIGFNLEAHVEIAGVGFVALLTYLSHIVADMFTPAGVKFLYPFIDKKFKIKL